MSEKAKKKKEKMKEKEEIRKKSKIPNTSGVYEKDYSWKNKNKGKSRGRPIKKEKSQEEAAAVESDSDLECRVFKQILENDILSKAARILLAEEGGPRETGAARDKSLLLAEAEEFTEKFEPGRRSERKKNVNYTKFFKSKKETSSSEESEFEGGEESETSSEEVVPVLGKRELKRQQKKQEAEELQKLIDMGWDDDDQIPQPELSDPSQSDAESTKEEEPVKFSSSSSSDSEATKAEKEKKLKEEKARKKRLAKKIRKRKKKQMNMPELDLGLGETSGPKKPDPGKNPDGQKPKKVPSDSKSSKDCGKLEVPKKTEKPKEPENVQKKPEEKPQEPEKLQKKSEEKHKDPEKIQKKPDEKIRPVPVVQKTTTQSSRDSSSSSSDSSSSSSEEESQSQPPPAPTTPGVSVIPKNSTEVLAFFGNPCLNFLNGRCQQKNCPSSHQIIAVQQFRDQLMEMPLESVELITNFLGQQRSLFFTFCPTLCDVFGQRNFLTQLKQLIGICENFQYFNFFHLIVGGLTNCENITEFYALKTLLEKQRTNNFEALDTMLELVSYMQHHIPRFMKFIRKFAQIEGYEIPLEVLERLVKAALDFKAPELIQFLVFYLQQHPDQQEDVRNIEELMKIAPVFNAQAS